VKEAGVIETPSCLPVLDPGVYSENPSPDSTALLPSACIQLQFLDFVEELLATFSAVFVVPQIVLTTMWQMHELPSLPG